MADLPLPPLTWLRAFEASARHLSFTLAAKELNLTQSAISQHVRSLEGHLGVELFLRKTRAIELTEAGANYLPVIRDAFDLIASGTRAFARGKRGENLIVQCNLAFATFWLAPRLHRFNTAYPWINLNLITPIWDPERSSRSASVEIRFGRQADMPTGAHRLTQTKFYPVAAPGFHTSWREAQLYDCAGTAGTWAAWLTGCHEELPENKQISMASTYVISMTAAQHGAGLAMAHDILAHGMIHSGHLTRPYPHAGDLPESYFLLKPPRYSDTEASTAFSLWLMEEMAQFQCDLLSTNVSLHD